MVMVVIVASLVVLLCNGQPFYDGRVRTASGRGNIGHAADDYFINRGEDIRGMAWRGSDRGRGILAAQRPILIRIPDSKQSYLNGI